MNILFVEDKGAVSRNIVKCLDRDGHQVFEATDIFDARSYWDDCAIGCIIADLNLDPAGLPEEMHSRTNLGLLTGWVWLQRMVLVDAPEMANRCIVYTDYLSKLLECIAVDDVVDGIHFVPKKGQCPLNSQRIRPEFLHCGEGVRPVHMVCNLVTIIQRDLEGAS